MKNIGKIKVILLVIFLTIFTFIPHFINLNASSSVILGGESIGMELNGKGLIVSNTTNIHYKNLVYNPTKDSDIKIGDYIYMINNQEITSVDDLENIINDLDGDILELNVKLIRDNKKLDRKLKVFKIQNIFKTGLFVKEKILGIGTLTFIDPKTNKYAALGHEVRDSNYKEIYPIESGKIYDSVVTGIKKSINGNPGEKIAEIDKKSVIGTIDKNTIFGIYGTINEMTNGKLIETSNIVKKGNAIIRTVINGNKVKEYNIDITNIVEQQDKATKGFSFKVTDDELIKQTNGIIQGMSGSPIIQDKKLIGAVTHVMVDNCTCGHAIYIRWMIDEMNN